MDALLSHDVRIYLDLKERLKAEFGLDDDDQTLLDTLDGETELDGHLIAMLRKARHDEANAEALANIIKDNQERKKRLEARAGKLRALVTWALSETGQKRLEAPDFTASLAKSKPPLLVTDEETAITIFPKCRPPELDRAALRESLLNGARHSFAALGNPEFHLTVRVR